MPDGRSSEQTAHVVTTVLSGVREGVTLLVIDAANSAVIEVHPDLTGLGDQHLAAILSARHDVLALDEVLLGRRRKRFIALGQRTRY